jgi:hypothetical protein
MTRFGICDTCIHAKLIRNTRGSVFLMCGWSKQDPAFPKYPPQPVVRCPAHESPKGPSDS